MSINDLVDKHTTAQEEYLRATDVLFSALKRELNEARECLKEMLERFDEDLVYCRAAESRWRKAAGLEEE